MDPRSSKGSALLAPAAAARSATVLCPGVDDRLVVPETRQEMLDGRLVYALPAHAPHGDRHCDLAAVVRIHLAPGWVGSLDLLTRSSSTSDFAPDMSVRADGTDPATGQRYLEELAFEIVSEQSLSVATQRVAVMAQRGVRRLFALVLKTRSVLEWSHDTRDWKRLAPGSAIRDRCFVRALSIDALLDSADADTAIASALLAREHPVIEAALTQREAKGKAEGEAKGKAEGEAKGKAEGKAEGEASGFRTGIEMLCEVLGIDVTPERQRALKGMDVADLSALATRIKTTRAWPT